MGLTGTGSTSIDINYGDVAAAQFKQLEAWSVLCFQSVADMATDENNIVAKMNQFRLRVEAGTPPQKVQLLHPGATQNYSSTGTLAEDIYYMICITNDGTGGAGGARGLIYRVSDLVEIDNKTFTYDSDDADLTKDIQLGKGGASNDPYDGEKSFFCYVGKEITPQDAKNFTKDPWGTMLSWRAEGTTVTIFSALGATSGTTEPDFSGSGNNGTISGSPARGPNPPVAPFPRYVDHDFVAAVGGAGFSAGELRSTLAFSHYAIGPSVLADAEGFTDSDLPMVAYGFFGIPAAAPVTKDSLLRFGLVKLVEQTLGKRFDLGGSVQKTQLERFDLDEQVQQTVPELFDLFEQAEGTRLLRWDQRDVISVDRLLREDHVEGVEQTQAERFDLLDQITQTLLIRLDIEGGPAPDALLRWDQKGPLSVDNLERFDTERSVTKDSLERFDLTTSVEQILAPFFDLLSGLQPDVLLRFDQKGPLSVDSLLRWDQVETIEGTRGLLFDFVTTVFQTGLARFDLTDLIAATRLLRFDQKGPVFADNLERFDMERTVSVDRGLLLDHVLSLFTDRLIRWDQVDRVLKDVLLRQDQAGLVSADQLLRADFIGVITQTSPILFDLGLEGVVSATSTLRFDVQAAVAREVLLFWDIEGGLQVGRSFAIYPKGLQLVVKPGRGMVVHPTKRYEAGR